MRQSTSEHTRKTNLRLQERQDAPRRRRGAHRDRPLTQEELLAEAKLTAEVNIRSLGEFLLVKLLAPELFPPQQNNIIHYTVHMDYYSNY